MADKIFHSTAVTFVDMTDSRILDVYISSNHPTVQICNVNKTPLEYTPDWSVNNLKLASSFRLLCSERSKFIDFKEKKSAFSFAKPINAEIAVNKKPFAIASAPGAAVSGRGIDRLLILISLTLASENMNFLNADISGLFRLLLRLSARCLSNFSRSANIIRLNSRIFSSARIILTVRISVSRRKSKVTRSAAAIIIFTPQKSFCYVANANLN